MKKVPLGEYDDNYSLKILNLAISLIKGTGGFVPDAGSTTHGTDYPF